MAGFYINHKKVYRLMKAARLLRAVEPNTPKTCNLPPKTFWNQWQTGHVQRAIISQKERKVRFLLKIPRQQIQKVEPAGKESRREVLSR